MFDVLVFVYEHYWEAQSCPEFSLLGRRLSAAGFEGDEIEQALNWLAGLDAASKSAELIDLTPRLNNHRAKERSAESKAETNIDRATQAALFVEPAIGSMRIYTPSELQRLGSESLGFLKFLESAGVMPCAMREIVIDQAMAAPTEHTELSDFKIIILMVYWSFGIEPEVLILDELCDDESRDERLCH